MHKILLSLLLIGAVITHRRAGDSAKDAAYLPFAGKRNSSARHTRSRQ